MGNDSDKSSGLLQILQGSNCKIQGFRIKCSESFINEDGIKSDTSCVGLNNIRKAQCQSERCEE